MKNLDQFITEKKKEKENSSPKPIHPDAGADDEMYIKLMVEYKKLRRHDHEKAEKIREKAKRLMKDGDVSDEAVMGAAYL